MSPRKDELFVLRVVRDSIVWFVERVVLAALDGPRAVRHDLETIARGVNFTSHLTRTISRSQSQVKSRQVKSRIDTPRYISLSLELTRELTRLYISRELTSELTRTIYRFLIGSQPMS